MSKSYVSVALKKQVAADFRYCCAYCQTPQRYTGEPLVFDHIIPESKGGATTRENLCFACHRCNDCKGSRTHFVDPLTEQEAPLFNPRTDLWAFHFVWSEDGSRMIGLTAIGRATIIALRCNDPIICGARTYWVTAGWHPPND